MMKLPEAAMRDFQFSSMARISCVSSDGDWSYYYCSVSFGIRPALKAPSILFEDSEAGLDLSKIPTDDLLQEIHPCFFHPADVIRMMGNSHFVCFIILNRVVVTLM